MKKIILLATICSVALTGCSAAPNAFESARIQDCIDLAKNDKAWYDLGPGKFSSTGENQGIVTGSWTLDQLDGTGVFRGNYQCSVSGTDVVFDGFTQTE